MLYVMLLGWLWWNDLPVLTQISRNNQARREAERAYQSAHYARAVQLYTQLSNIDAQDDPAIRLNLGHAYFKLGQYQRAKTQYEPLLHTDAPALRTVAATQLGVIACARRDSAGALTLFEQALLEDPANEAARYDYELIRTRFSNRLPNRNQPPKSATPKQINQPKPSSSQVERSERQDERLRRFAKLNLNEEQALQLLDAMQTDDLPYALTRSARESATPATTPSRW
ncbi:tetratricopeptide repeat protein [Spirosoma rhododendri]|uniref:Tetratricopeptide repeat protein n=1 Tax=Spirosoma rhododendri TaxID=2728024 RepID=A0A7L5DLS7_9BACT|nr:tetratricopeptide repeat protein [Spirosoma rhododendri]QJD79366.1 tetratricopeptide repeat protein [Spirosoma rhododendri]